MRIINLAFIIFTAVAFNSCQKEINNTDPVVPTGNRIKTYTEDVTSGGAHNVVTFNLAYDANDRIISLTSAASPGDRFVYQYSNGGLTMDIYNSNQLNIHEVFFLNSNSLVDSTFQYNDTNDSLTEKYLYNSSKQLATLKSYNYSQVTGSVLDNVENYTYDSNGNAIKVTDNYSVTTYDYYTNLPGNFAGIVPYFPAGKNLVKTTTVTDAGGTTTLNHTYTFDTANRITTEKIVAGSGEIVIKTYTYY